MDWWVLLWIALWAYGARVFAALTSSLFVEGVVTSSQNQYFVELGIFFLYIVISRIFSFTSEFSTTGFWGILPIAIGVFLGVATNKYLRLGYLNLQKEEETARGNPEA